MLILHEKEVILYIVSTILWLTLEVYHLQLSMFYLEAIVVPYMDAKHGVYIANFCISFLQCITDVYAAYGDCHIGHTKVLSSVLAGLSLSMMYLFQDL